MEHERVKCTVMTRSVPLSAMVVPVDGGYHWDGLIAELILSNTYINIANLTLTPPT